MVKNQSVEINIEELVLHGFSRAHANKIGETLRSELAKLILEKGIPEGISEGGNINSVNGGNFQVSQNTHARTIGTQIAHSIYGGIGK